MVVVVVVGGGGGTHGRSRHGNSRGFGSEDTQGGRGGTRDATSRSPVGERGEAAARAGLSAAPWRRQAAHGGVPSDRSVGSVPVQPVAWVTLMGVGNEVATRGREGALAAAVEGHRT